MLSEGQVFTNTCKTCNLGIRTNTPERFLPSSPDSFKRSLEASSGPKTSMAEIRTENLVLEASFCSSLSRKSQAIAHGITPMVLRDASEPSIVLDLPVTTKIVAISIKGFSSRKVEDLKLIRAVALGDFSTLYKF